MTTTIFRNGSLFDGRRYRGQVGAVVVTDGVVAAVVENPDAPLPEGQIVDLAGGLVLPGFVDAHVHPVQAGLERVRCDLSGAHTRADYLAIVSSYAAEHPDEPWILGGGWSMDAFPGGTPLASDLDAVVPDRPAFLPNRDHHGAWVNSRALALVDSSVDPADGRFERDDDGRPTGTVHEGAMHLFEELLPPTTAEDLRRGLLAGQSYLHSVGVTSWQDALIGNYVGIVDPGPAYRAAALSGELVSDVVGALWWDRTRGVEQVPELVEKRAAYSEGRFRATSVKIMADGVFENFTAAMQAPYLDRCGHATTNYGMPFVGPQALAEAVEALDAEGFQIHVHAIGDAATHNALDAFAALPDPRRGRHHIAHLQIIDPSDVARFAELGVAANLQQLWACAEEQMVELTLPFLGAERARWQYPFGDLQRAGAHLCAGSDWPVSTPDPWAAIHVGVTRLVPGDGAREPFLPEQALTLEQSLAAYTSGSAWINGREDAVGQVAPGFAADLVVTDRDPFAGPAEDIEATRTVSTWIAGVPVYGV